MSDKLRYIILANLMFAVYSLTSVLGKYAAGEDGVTLRFVALYGLSLTLMGVYAIGWQQVIKRIPLMVAYANKAVVVLWGLIWGVLLFGEAVTAGKLIGMAMVMAGIILFAGSDESEIR